MSGDRNEAALNPLRGTRQIERSVSINADRAAVWAVLSDARHLAKWVPAVSEVTDCSVTGEDVGTTRTCQATIGRKAGTVVERCIEFTPQQRIAHVVDLDTFGLGRMFDDYGFAMTLTETSPTVTKVTIATHYTPKNPAYRVLNAVLMRRQFGKVCDGIVNGLKAHVEQRVTGRVGA